MLIQQASFTVFDVETTGLDPRRGDRIVEIAGVRIEDGVVSEDHTFISLVNPQCAVSIGASRVNKIFDEDLIHAPTISEVMPSFLDFAKGSILVAHNAVFDLGFLQAEKEMCWGYIDIPECLCTLCLSRAVFPQEFRHNLDVVSSRLGLSLPKARHRALPDVLLTAQALLRLVDIGNIQTIDDLRKKASPKPLAWRS